VHSVYKSTLPILLIAALFSACQILRQLKGTADKAISVIEDGIDDIQSESSSWRTVLQRVADELPGELSEIIRTDAQNLAQRGIAVAGTEVRCNIDFLAGRAIAGLKRLKAKILGQDQPMLPPAFCQVTPDALDLNVSPESWSKLTIYGYDLDHADANGNLLAIGLLDRNNTLRPLPEDRIGRTTHYQVTVNLGDMASTLHSSGTVKLQISWNGSRKGFPEVVVLPWKARTRSETKNLGRTSYMPPHRGGDRDFNTHDDEPMSVDVRAELRIADDHIDSRVYMYAREERKDWTKVEGWSDWARAYTAPSNWKITQVRPRINSRHTANINEKGRKEYSRPAGEVVSRFEVWGDEVGQEAGTWTHVEVHWRPIEVELHEKAPPWLR
jgi:hypothetical protein